MLMMMQKDPALGDQLGRYRLVGEIARGGMGIVYVANAQGPAGFNKLVAIKELKPELVRDEEFLTMFLDEARTAARLNHPNIVQTLDVSEWEGRHFITMEYLEGRSLFGILKHFSTRGGFPLRMSLAMLRDALGALDYAHKVTDAKGRLLGFVHRDMSPHNVLLTYDGHTKVIDFGIAKARDSSLETKTGVLKGRLSYMAPEQLTHRGDGRADIFSIGAMLYEVITGHRLWEGRTDVEIFGCLTRGNIPQVTSATEDAPPLLLEICRTALSEKPENRFATAEHMRDALDEFLWASDGPPRQKEIAALLDREFGAERQQVRETIERSLGRLEAGERARLEPVSLGEAREPTHRSRGSQVSRLANLAPPAFAPQAFAPQTLAPEVLAPAPLTGVGDKVLRLLHRPGAVAGTLLSLVFVGTVLLVAGPRSTQSDAPPITHELMVAPAAAHRPSAPPPPPALPETVQLSVTVSPSSAQVTLDGEAMPSNPFLGRFPKSDSVHRIRAAASGFEPKERLVSFSDSVMLDLNLTPKPAVRAQPPRREAPRRERPVSVAPSPVHVASPAQIAPLAPASAPARAPSPADISPRSPSDPPRRRAIDTTNPYAGDEK